MEQNAVGRWPAGGGLQVPLRPSLFNARDLHFECAKVLHETLLVPVLLYGSETFRVRAVQMDIIRGLLGIRRMDRVPNAWIRKLCGVKKGLDERIDEGVLW